MLWVLGFELFGYFVDCYFACVCVCVGVGLVGLHVLFAFGCLNRELVAVCLRL